MAKGSCQSGTWEKPQKIEQPTIRYGSWGSIVNASGEPDASSVTCASDEIVVGGGGACYDPGRAWIHTSMPDGNNGWVVNCFGFDILCQPPDWQEPFANPVLGKVVSIQVLRSVNIHCRLTAKQRNTLEFMTLALCLDFLPMMELAMCKKLVAAIGRFM